MTMSVDTFSNMLSFLDIRSIENLQQTDKEHKKVVDKFSHIYYENALKEQYGESIIMLLKITDDDYRKNIKTHFNAYKLMTINNSIKILEMFYNSIHQNKITTNHHLFIMIYDLCYTLLTTMDGRITMYGQIKEILKKHRDDFILKHYSEADIKNNGLNYIMNATKHIDRWGENSLFV